MELGEDYGDDNRFDVDGVNTLRYVFNFNVNKISDVSHIFKLAIDDGFFKTEQTVKEHSENVAILAEEYAVERFKKIAYVTGLLHDCGKYQESFQKRNIRK